MNKGLVLAVGILALAALSVWFFTSNPSTSEFQNATTTVPITPAQKAVTPPVPASKPKAAIGVPDAQTSFKSLLTQTGSYQCDYEQVRSSGQSRNVIFIYNGTMRGEFRTQEANGNTTANLFVYDGKYMYQWQEGSSVGTKTLLTSLSQLPYAIPKDLTSGAIVGTSYESVGWLCHSWLTNKSLMTPPSYVTFRALR